MPDKKKIEHFKHVLVPEHFRLSQDETREVLAKYQIFSYQLPRIKASDPALSELQVSPGDVVKIIRKSQTSGEAIVYRYVVEG